MPKDYVLERRLKSAAKDRRIAELEMMILRLIEDAHRMHMIGPGYKDQGQAMLYAEAQKLIGRSEHKAQCLEIG
jgi:hypothetical protein